MKTVTTAASILFLLAAGVWALGSEPAPSGTAAETPPPLAETASRSDDSPPHPAADDVVVRRILSGADADLSWSPSPDGRHASFVDWSTGDVALRELRTGDVRRLTSNEDPALSTFPVSTLFSPDGGRIAYAWDLGHSYDLRILDVETAEERTLASALVLTLEAWSPDGTTLAAVLFFEDGSRRIALVPTDGGELAILRSFDWQPPENLAFSPDGKWIAYDVQPDEDSEGRNLVLLAGDGSREVTLLEGPAHHQVVGWLPDGGPLFYLRREGERTRLLAVQVEDGRAVSEPRTVRSDLWDVTPLGFTREALHYAVAVESPEVYSASFDPERGELVAPLRPVASGGLGTGARFLSWEPEGGRMAYVVTPLRGGMGPDRIVIRSLATGQERSVEVPAGYIQSAAWEPGAERLLVRASGLGNRSGVFLLDLEDGEAELLLESFTDERTYHGPRWTADGRIVVTRRDRTVDGTEGAVVRYDPGSGQEEVLFRTAAGESHALSPDGSRLAVARGVEGAGREWEVVVVPLSADVPIRVTALSPGEAVQDVEWTPDGERLLLLSRRHESGRHGIHLVPADGSESPRTLAELPGFAWDLRIHPDGRRIALGAGALRWEIWAMENLGSVVTDIDPERRSGH